METCVMITMNTTWYVSWQAGKGIDCPTYNSLNERISFMDSLIAWWAQIHMSPTDWKALNRTWVESCRDGLSVAVLVVYISAPGY